MSMARYSVEVGIRTMGRGGQWTPYRTLMCRSGVDRIVLADRIALYLDKQIALLQPALTDPNSGVFGLSFSVRIQPEQEGGGS